MDRLAAAADAVCRTFTGLSDTPRCTITALVAFVVLCMIPHITGLHQRCLFNCAHRDAIVHTATISPAASPTVNYALCGSSKFSQTRIRLAVNNLTNSHAITGVAPASAKSNLPAPGDVLTLMAGRSVSVSLTVGFSPSQP